VRHTAVRPRLAAPAGFALLALVATALPASAVIQKLLPLKDVLAGEDFIFVATVDEVLPDKPGVVFRFEGKLKGDSPFTRIPVNLTGDNDAKKGDHTKVLLERLETGRKLVVFAHKEEKKYEAMAFMEGTWFSLQGTIDEDGNTVRWAFLHCEPYLRRTFKGTTAELKKVIEDALAKKADPPGVNEKEKPGFGPPIEKKDPKKCAAASGTLFGVIPSLALIAPLALLGAIFPGVAARLSIAMKRWRAFLVIASTNSTLAILYFFFRQYLPDWRLLNYQGFTALLVASTAVGLIWAGQRYRRMAGEDPAITGTPSRRECYALGGLIGLIAVILLITRLFGNSWNDLVDLPMREFTLIGIALVAATFYAVYRMATRSSDRLPDGTQPATRISLSGESVGLLTLLLGGVVSLCIGGTSAHQAIALGTQTGDGDESFGPRLADVRVFEIAEAHQIMSNGIALQGDRLFVGATRQTGFKVKAFMTALDRNDGREAWRFTNGGDLKPIFSSAAVAGGKLYFGEGLHEDSGCRLFCLHAATGKPAWAKPFQTSSHTEGNPRIVGGRVYFTAGDDGLFCADAGTGEMNWQFPGRDRGLHIDGPPAVAGNRVFIGSGLYTLAVLAVDAATGQELWRTPVKLRSFGAPLAIGNRVVYGLGTGNMSADVFKYPEEKDRDEEKAPAGAVICVEADSGAIAWQYDMPRSVHTALAADAFSVYAASRDGAVHCLDRKTGTLRWKTVIGATITSGPAVASSSGMPVAVYAISTEGTMVCLNTQNGKVCWARDLREQTKKLVEEVYTTPAVVIEATPTGSRRIIYTGAMLKNPNNGAKTAAVFRFEDELGE
jgi:outer membrane protein assembly factor BamB